MTVEINCFSNVNIENSSKASETVPPSKTEAVMNKMDLFSLPAEIIDLTLRKLRPSELNIFQLSNKSSDLHSNNLKTSYAQEFGYEVGFLESKEFLNEIYREVEALKRILPANYLAYDPNTQEFDPETTLRNLQKLNINDCCSIFSQNEFYSAQYRKTRKYLIKIADKLFSQNDMSQHIGQMNCMMQTAIKRSDVDSIALFLNHGVDIEDIDSSQNPMPALLHACRYSNSLDVFELLLSRGANIDAQYASRSNIFGFFTLNEHCATNKELHLSFVKFFLNRGVDPNIGNAHGVTPLHTAILKKNFALINLLLNHGANIHQPNHAGQTPLALAFKSWSPRIINMCLLGFDPYAED